MSSNPAMRTMQPGCRSLSVTLITRPSAEEGQAAAVLEPNPRAG
jgi:hypothetical protein